MKAKLLWSLRWLLALPVASVAVLAVSFPVHWAVMLMKFTFESGETMVTWEPGTFPAEAIERLGYAFFSPATFIYCAGRVVPAFRLQVGGVLALLWAVLLGGVWALILFRVPVRGVLYYSPGGWPYIIIAIALGLAGAVTGLYSLYRWERRRG